MPELPEVENVVRSLNLNVAWPQKLTTIEQFRKDLRWAIPTTKLKKLFGQKIITVSRRAKYILFEFEQAVIISHLGMTGKWSIVNSFETKKKAKHDHLVLTLSDKILVYNDPRRFGFIDVIERKKLPEYFKNLGAEPFAELTPDLIKKIRQSQSAIKALIMDQKLIVGIGNIYACEALFQSKINPQTKGSQLSNTKIKDLFAQANLILASAINAGGSSISNYSNAKGDRGSYQQNHLVYGQESKPCVRCQKPIVRIVQSGRSTFYCKTCQKK